MGYDTEGSIQHVLNQTSTFQYISMNVAFQYEDHKIVETSW